MQTLSQDRHRKVNGEMRRVRLRSTALRESGRGSTYWCVWLSTRSHLSSATRNTAARLMGSEMVCVRPSRTSSTVRLFLEKEKKAVCERAWCGERPSSRGTDVS